MYDKAGGQSKTIAECIPERNPADLDARMDADTVIKLVLRDFGITAALFLRLRFLEGCTLNECGKAFGGITESGRSIKQRMLLAKLRHRFAPSQLAALAIAAA